MKTGELRHRVNEIWRDVPPGADLHAGAFVRVEVLGAVFTLPITAVSLDGDGDGVVDVRPSDGAAGGRTVIPDDGMVPAYLINPLILERFRSHPEEWQREWIKTARVRNRLYPWWAVSVTEEGIEACAALLWWVSYRGANYPTENYPTENYPTEQQPGGGDHADTL